MIKILKNKKILIVVGIVILLSIGFLLKKEEMVFGSGNDAQTVSLLHMNGTDGSTTFTDDATGGTHTWTAVGDAQIDTIGKFNQSGLFDGNGDYISTPDSTDFDLGTADFTVDFWIKITSASKGNYIFYTGALTIYIQNPSGAVITTYTGGNLLVLGTTNVTNDEWHHVALVRNSGTFTLYIDGTSEGTPLTEEHNLDSSIDPITISNSSYPITGYIDEFRISKGIARWTANFTPPTEEYSGVTIEEGFTSVIIIE